MAERELLRQGKRDAIVRGERLAADAFKRRSRKVLEFFMIVMYSKVERCANERVVVAINHPSRD